MNGSARGIFAPGDPHGFNRTRRQAFDKADVILIVGSPFDFRLGYGRRLRSDATVVQIDLDYRNVGKNRDISLGLVGDCGAILNAVAQAATGRASKGNAVRAEWMKELRAAEGKAYEKLLPSFKSESMPINPYRVAYEINEFLTDNTVYIGDGGDVVTITATAVEPRQAGNWMDPGPLGTLGVGTSFAMATKLVHPKKEVLCYYGDGSFGMTSWDMETAQRFGLPYIAVIGNNSAMNQIRCGQIGKYGPERGCIGNKLGDVDFEKFADCFGAWGIAVREPKQIRPALDQARERVAGGQCAIVNIWVDPNEYAPGTQAQTMYK
jgi:acetolactate synthase-1/2/3 large subunit